MIHNHDATALVIDAMQLVAMQDISSALELLRNTDIDPSDLQHVALDIMAFILSGGGAPERFAELRAQIHELALQHGPDDRQVVLNLEVIATSEALAERDTDRANEIVTGSMFSAIDISWCAVCLTGQCVRGWLGEGDLAEFWTGQRRHWGAA